MLGLAEAFAGFEVGEPMVIERPHPFGRDVERGYDFSQVFAFGEGGEDGGSLVAWGAPSWPSRFGRHRFGK